MAFSSGNSAESTQLQKTSSEEDMQLLMDQRKRKRMQSNRESARRSRMRKQKHMDDLRAQVAQLRKQNAHILTRVNIATRHYLNVEAENSVLKAQTAELSQRLHSLNDILNYISTTGTVSEVEADQDLNQTSPPHSFMNNPCNFMFFNQPIMASADIFQY